jgi:outer membrane protein TolC
MRRQALSVLTLLVPAVMAAQEAPVQLTLDQALERAKSGHPAVARARATRQWREADRTGSMAAYLPQVTSAWSLVRTDDPVAVFGSKLRQGKFTETDLALDALNRPSPISNVAVELTVEQPLVTFEGWSGRKAAGAGAEAGRLAEARVLQVVQFDALASYFGAAVASARVEVLDTALAAARQTLDQVRALRREGVVTQVDEQLVLARVSELEAQLATADADRQTAADRLLLVLGEDPGRAVELVDPLEMTTATDLGSSSRLDVEALRQGVAAAVANIDRARFERLPSVGAFGSMSWNQPNLGIFSGSGHWTVGMAVRWSPFRGLRDRADLARARAEHELMEAELSTAQRNVSAEIRSAEARHQAAVAGVAAAERALDYAAQAARIATSRYTGGVATISELLAVRAAEATTRLARLEALYQARVAAAQLRLARGGDPR